MKPIKNRLIIVLLAVLAILLAAPAGWTADEAFRAGPGGLRLKDLTNGTGLAAEPGMIATIHFIGWVDEQGARGREIYNSRREGHPVSFVVGTDGVMQGWNAGVLGMQPGGSRMLLIPPGMAYGNREVDGTIPANSAMMFRIELVSLEYPAGS